MEKNTKLTTQEIKALLAEQHNNASVRELDGLQFPLPAINTALRAAGFREFEVTSEEEDKRVIFRQFSQIQPNINPQRVLWPSEGRVNQETAVIEIPSDSRHISTFVVPSGTPDPSVAAVYIQEIFEQFSSMNPDVDNQVTETYGQQITLADLFAYSLEQQKLIFLG
jgi:hypothetical protein